LNVPTPEVEEQKVFPVIPVPLHVPPAGVATIVTHGSDIHIVAGVTTGTMFRTNTFIFTVGPTQPNWFVGYTVIALGIKPGLAPFQLTVIELDPCPLTRTPGEATVQV